MKKLCLFISYYFFSNSLLAYSSDPKEFITELVNDAISKLSDKNLNKDEKANLLKKLL